MSTLVYAALTSKRDQATKGTSFTSGAPGMGAWVDALAALVPSEVLAAHAAVLAVTTVTDRSTGIATEITDPATLKWAFFALLPVSSFVYIGARLVAHAWNKFDYLRMLIPPLAFFGWSMVQRTTGFDAAFPNVTLGARTAVGAIGAVVLGTIASLLAYRADQA